MRTNIYSRFLYLLTVIMCISSCDPDEDVPAYLSIDHIDLKINDPAVEGTASAKITDAWIYIDSKLLGVFELPARFPVLASGSKNVIIGAGVMENGISATRIIYPFYKGIETVANFVPGQTVIISSAQQVSYFSGIAFPWRADFENAILKFRETTSSNVKLNLVSDASLKFEGTHSAVFTVKTDSTVFDGEADDSLLITTNQQTFLEMNYKGEQPFDVGFTVVASNGDKHREYALTVNRSDEWNKIYINLSSIVNSNASTSKFRLYLHAVLEDGRQESTIYIDNLKLVHF